MLKLPGVFAVELLGAGLERSALFTMASDDEEWVDSVARTLAEEEEANRREEEEWWRQRYQDRYRWWRELATTDSLGRMMLHGRDISRVHWRVPRASWTN